MAWNQIRGHDEVRRQLETAVRQNRLAHAYLLVGPQGVGKRLFARELTKSLLCEQPPAPFQMCDQCPACAQVNVETHPDLFMVRTPDDKIEMPVDVMRSFCVHLGLKATRGAWKIGIIEDADDFNEESANTFLKLLEEPPRGTLLLLLATSVQLQLPTIRSRCQTLHFYPLSPPDVGAIMTQADITEPQRIPELIRMSQGSPGRALALADPGLWTFRTEALELLARPRPDSVALSMAWIQNIESVGKDGAKQRPRTSLQIGLILDHLRTTLRTAAGEPSTDQLVNRLATRCTVDRLVQMMVACTEAEYQIQRRISIPLIIELLADRLCES